MLSRFSRVRLFATLWTVACQVPLSMGFSGKNTGVGCHFFLQRIFLNSHPLRLLHWQVGSLPLGTEAKPRAGCSHGLAQSDPRGEWCRGLASHQLVIGCGHPGAGNHPR